MTAFPETSPLIPKSSRGEVAEGSNIPGLHHHTIDRTQYQSEVLSQNRDWELEEYNFHYQLARPIEYPVPGIGTYDIYQFNQERFDPQANTIAYFHPLGSSPNTWHGQRMLWQLQCRFPDNLVVALGSEDARGSRVRRIDPETMVRSRTDCLQHVRGEHGLDQTSESGLDMVGQSLGGMLACEVARDMQEHGQSPDRLVLLGLPLRNRSRTRLLAQLAQQEGRDVSKRSPGELSRIGRAACDTLPDSPRNCRSRINLLSYITNTEPDLQQLSRTMNITLCNGERDSVASVSQAELADTSDPNTLLTVARDAHTTLLIDADFCGHIVETSLSPDREEPVILPE